MKLLLVSWEYPPVVVGGLGRHVHNLAVELAKIGHDVVVLTRRPTGSDATTHPTTLTTAEGVRVIAAAEDPPEFDFGADMMPWTLAMGHAMIRAGLRLLRDDGTGEAWTPDVVHAHDWLVAHPAIALAEFFDVPLVATIHATEAGRHSGWVAAKTNRQVHSVEWWLAREADALVTCSTSMRDEVSRLFGPELAEIQVIHNGIAVQEWPHSPRAVAEGPAELLFAGRLEYEKGVQDLLAALPRIRRTHPGTTLTIAGSGTQQDWLEELTRKHRVVGAVRFLGAVDRSQLIELMHRCSAIVLPSRYEPFGIVALEAAATGIPLVTSTAGGLGEAVTDSITGMTFPPADVTALAAAVRATLDDPAAAEVRAQRAYARLTEEFSWRTVAERTAGVYLAAKRRVRHPIGRPNIVERPLPERDPNQPL
ncbi:glycosyltransferase family 4 protein [Gordonia crocea]|uniref:Putative glycosyl transferase n=1 Tax=Gordonia crocea TaxID=589162 RepID=A0A7I9UZQ6_9ACTN|nr:glycosyltransferase family 4 protein [Gordonia crocea]GED98359.1 putative glycosyl transferase [Gordonia crocea]